MKIQLLFFLLFSSFFIYAQSDQRKILTETTIGNQLTQIEFHVNGMNSETAKNTVINSINKFPGKIISWSPNITNQTIKISFTEDEQAIDILELISATGYKPWYINQNGMKVVLIGTNKTEEHYIKPQ